MGIDLTEYMIKVLVLIIRCCELYVY